MKIKGILHKKYNLNQVTDNFCKMDFILKYQSSPNHPQYIDYPKFELHQDSTSLLDHIAEGSEIEVDFEIKGREWVDKEGEIKYFNTLKAWRVTRVEKNISTSHSIPIHTEPEHEQDDLPF